MEKLTFRTNNFLIEFEKINRFYFFYIVRRLLSFVFDSLLFVAMQFLLYFIFKIEIIFASFYSIIFSFAINFLTIFLLKNKTLGMFLAGIVIGNMDGRKIPKNKIFIRTIIFSIFSVPLIGWILIILEIFSFIFNRGIGIIDFFSKTQVFSKFFYKHVQKTYFYLDKKTEK